MGREENMEMERSRRQYEHEKKFGKDKEPEIPYNYNEIHHPIKKAKVSMMTAAHKAAEELRMEGKGSHDPAYKDSHKNK